MMVASTLICGCGGTESGELPTEPTLADLHTLVFVPTCVSSGCHDATAAGQLDLSTVTSSRQGLIDAPPTNKLAGRSGWVRVAPGDLERSFLYRKVTQPGLGEGAPMPMGLQLTAPYIELITRWIESGAP